MQCYYKLTEEDMEEITNEWPAEFRVPVEDVQLSDPDIIGSPLVTRAEHDGQGNGKKKKKREEVQDIENEDKDNASKETASDSLAGGGRNEVDQEEEGEEDKQDKGRSNTAKGSPYRSIDVKENEGFPAENLSVEEIQSN
jgi:hypothetical protein